MQATPSDADFARQELARRELCRRDLFRFVCRTFPNFKANWHHRLLCDRLQAFSEAVTAGKSPRLIVTMPPRHTKSTIVSQRLPVWHMGRNPDHDVVCASYAQTLANKHSRAARGIAADSAVIWQHVDLDAERKAVEEWQTVGGGTYRAVGVGGGLTGMGAHVAIIDDPIKDWSEAQSALVRQSVKDWFDSVLLTRLAPGAGILVTQTRWHSDDLAGWLIAEDRVQEWEVFNLPAIAEVDETPYRIAGAALHPERYPLSSLEAIRERNPMVFAALYQQRPTPAEGGIIRAEWLRQNRYDERSHRTKVKRLIHSWDTASKAKEINDPSLCWTLAERHDGAVEVWSRWKGRVVFPDLLDQIKQLADAEKPDVIIIEDKSSGQEALAMLRRDPKLRRLLIAATPTTDKVTRMTVETPALESGSLLWPERAAWLADGWEVLLTFPSGAHDEEVDALSQALQWLRTGAAQRDALRAIYG